MSNNEAALRSEILRLSKHYREEFQKWNKIRNQMEDQINKLRTQLESNAKNITKLATELDEIRMVVLPDNPGADFDTIHWVNTLKHKLSEQVYEITKLKNKLSDAMVQKAEYFDWLKKNLTLLNREDERWGVCTEHGIAYGVTLEIAIQNAMSRHYDL